MMTTLLIDLYCHCQLCLEERPAHISPHKWVDMSIGLTKSKTHIQIWCERHQAEVALLELATPLNSSKCTCEDCD